MEEKIIVENREFNNKVIGKNYADIIIFSLRNSPVEGMTIQGMRDIQSDLESLEESTDNAELLITAKSFEHIVKVIPQIPWKEFNKELIDMDDYFNSLIKE